MLRLWLLVILSIPLAAQEPAPKYLLTAGGGWDRGATPQNLLWGAFSVRLGEANYAYTSLETAGKLSSVRAGYSHILIRQGRFRLMTMTDAGLVAGHDNLGGAFAGGGMLAYRIFPGKVPHLYVVGVLRVVKTALDEIRPTIGIGISKGF